MFERREGDREDRRASFCERWLESNATPQPLPEAPYTWRLLSRMKTVHLALIMALNLGTDPPDVLRMSPCARMECWLEPSDLPPEKDKAATILSEVLQEQYMRWQPRARYKRCIDPTVEEIHNLARSMRRAAKDTRVLIHYNGRGVPKPTSNGEIWLFNPGHTQYVPLSLFDLDMWLDSPAVYVFDCSHAGVMVRWCQEIIHQRDQFHKDATHDCIVLAACGEQENLPTNAGLPADLFTACLTTPIKMALHWACVRSVLFTLDTEYIEEIPGQFADRRSPLGELNWIFTAVTDTIAWLTLPAHLFQRLFRQDALVASLMRNFLLAERILKATNCTPLTLPSLPPMSQHALWNAWDLAVDFYLAGLPLMMRMGRQFAPNPFFPDQLTAFELYLDSTSKDKHSKKPTQLPIVLQVLLSKQYRQRALHLLSRFMSLGRWAVQLALSVGTFPYVLKLLSSPAPELASDLTLIWAHILAVDPSCCEDLLKEEAELYFVPFLRPSPSTPLAQTLQAAFVLSKLMEECPEAQESYLRASLMALVVQQLHHPHPRYRCWLLLVLAKQWEEYPDARAVALSQRMHELLLSLLMDADAQVRTAAIYAISTLLEGPHDDEEDDAVYQESTHLELRLLSALAVVTADMSSIARKELIVTVIRFIFLYESEFRDAVLAISRENVKYIAVVGELRKSLTRSPSTRELPPREEFPPSATAYQKRIIRVWRMLLSLCHDPHPNCASLVRRFIRGYYSYLAGLSTIQGEPALVQHLHRMSDESGLSSSSRQARRRTATGLRSSAGGLSFSESPGESPVHGAGALGESGESAGDLLNPSAYASQFYGWACQDLFAGHEQPQDPTAPFYMECHWRQRQQDVFYDHTQRLKEVAARSRFDHQIALINDSHMDVPLLTLMHPSEPICLFADNKSRISVWNWEVSVRLGHFHNLGPEPISAMSLVNTQQRYRLVVGSRDGVVRVWGDTDSSPHLITAWRAFAEPPKPQKTPLVMDWNENESRLLTGINGTIRVWDVERGLSVQDISAGYTATSLAHHYQQPLVITGHEDGSLALFDCRESRSRYAPTHRYRGHRGQILRAKIPHTLSGTLVVSGAASGEVKLWDLRQEDQSIRSLQMHQRGMAAFDVHDHAPIFSTGGTSQIVKVTSYQTGNELSAIRYHSHVIMGQRVGPICSLAFHPYRLVLTAGATDSLVSIYESNCVIK